MSALLAMRFIPRASLHKTTIEDLSYDHDMIVPQTKKGSCAVWVKVE